MRCALFPHPGDVLYNATQELSQYRAEYPNISISPRSWFLHVIATVCFCHICLVVIIFRSSNIQCIPNFYQTAIPTVLTVQKITLQILVVFPMVWVTVRGILQVCNVLQILLYFTLLYLLRCMPPYFGKHWCNGSLLTL